MQASEALTRIELAAKYSGRCFCQAASLSHLLPVVKACAQKEVFVVEACAQNDIFPHLMKPLSLAMQRSSKNLRAYCDGKAGVKLSDQLRLQDAMEWQGTFLLPLLIISV